MTDPDAQTQAPRRAALRDAVLAAAERRMTQHGLAGLAVRDIARDAGCAVGMIYKLFVDHDALVLAVNARTLAELWDITARATADQGTQQDALRRMADAYLDYAAANTPRWDALFAHRMAPGATLPGWYAELRADLFRRIAANALPDADAAFARTLFAAVHGVVSLGLASKLTQTTVEDVRADLRRLLEVIADGVGR